mgnify:CR=1 FL=1
MKIPKLKKIESVKKHHGISLEDDYAWVDQPNILEVLKDPGKLLPDVKEYIKEIIPKQKIILRMSKIYKKKYLMRLNLKLN